MSQRDKIEDAFCRYLLARQGLSYHRRGMARREVAVTDMSGHPFPKGQAAYDEATVMARELFEVLLRRLDGNRLALEIVSAYGNLGGDDFGLDAVSDTSRAGAAIKLALATRETFPGDYTLDGAGDVDLDDAEEPQPLGADLEGPDGSIFRLQPPHYRLPDGDGVRYRVIAAGAANLGSRIVAVTTGDTVTAPSGWHLTN